MSVTISCSNGSIKDGSKKVTCSGTKCYPDSYTYCNKLTKGQITTLIIIGVVGLIATSIVSYFLSWIPILGRIGALLINLSLLVILAIVIYVVYNNSKAKPKPKEGYIEPELVPTTCQ